MRLRDEILGMIEAARPGACPLEEQAHLCADLGFDSFSSMQLLLAVEARYAITFALPELGECLQVAQLIALAEQKRGSLP